MVEGGIDKSLVISCRDSFMEGMLINTPKGKAKLIKKYPNYAQTDKGNWKWIEIYLAEHGTMCDDRKKLIHEEKPLELSQGVIIH